MATPRATRFARIGTEVLTILNAGSATSNGANLGAVFNLGSPYSNFAFRVQTTAGAGSSGNVQLMGGIGASSTPATSLVPLTTFILGTDSTADGTIFVTGKPCNLVAANITVFSSSGTTYTCYVAATA